MCMLQTRLYRFFNIANANVSFKKQEKILNFIQDVYVLEGSM